MPGTSEGSMQPAMGTMRHPNDKVGVKIHVFFFGRSLKTTFTPTTQSNYTIELILTPHTLPINAKVMCGYRTNPSIVRVARRANTSKNYALFYSESLDSDGEKP